MSTLDWLSSWDVVVASGDPAAIEGAWLARLEAGVGDGTELAEALRRLRTRGKKTLAATLLELAAEQAGSDGAWAARRLFLVELIRLGIGDGERWRGELEECVRHVWAGRPSLENLLEEFPLRGARKPLEALEQLENWLAHDIGGVFAMAGRGAGRVVEANPKLGTLRLDFEGEKRVPVPIDAAPRFLNALPPGHFLRRRLEDRSSLAREAAGDPGGTLTALLESFGTSMSVSEIKAALAGVVSDQQWSTWWTKARKLPRLVSSGSGSRISYRLAGGAGAEEEIRAEFLGATLAKRMELARRHGTRSKELGTLFAAELAGAVTAPDAEPASAWEALALARRLGASAHDVEAAQQELVRRVGAGPLLGLLADPQQREAVLDSVRHVPGQDWLGIWAEWLEHETHPRVLSRLAGALVDAGKTKEAQAFLDRVFVNPTKAPAAFIWACELDGGLASLVEEKRGGALLVRIVELAERKEFTALRGRLKELLSAGGLAGRIVQDRLTLDQARRIVQVLDRPGDLIEERNWLRRAAVARFPDLRLQASVADVVPALAATVTRMQGELRDLLEKQIPETVKAIQVAKEHGDLSENFEYHAARARQEFLSARAASLQADLARVRVIDPAKVDTSRVRVGTRVWLRAADDGAEVAIVILGPYEAEPQRGVLSHASEAAQALLERAPGDVVGYDGRKWTVARIERAS